MKQPSLTLQCAYYLIKCFLETESDELKIDVEGFKNKKGELLGSFEVIVKKTEKKVEKEDYKTFIHFDD